MNKTVTAVALALLCCSATLASADSYDDCLADCSAVQTQCEEGITLYDPTGIQKAKQVCANDFAVCKKKCHDIDDLGVEEYQKMVKQQAEQAEQKRQEQGEIDNGNIKVYKFSE
jgi:hypothetical protein